ncbi:MAG TPA: sigma-70 family RNA polymerase sigma factor [Chryseolinea sp.]|nr:sigma-70 family RNA polymerase sigma factor [Chryseolinea sp.]
MQQINNNSSEDLELWEAMLRGDRNAFATLYERYFKLLYNYGRKISQDGSHVEDSIHDLFVDLWRYKSNLSTTTSVRFYLYRSLRRRLIKKNNNVLWLSHDIHLLEEVLQLSSPSSENQIIESESADYRVNQLKKLLNDLSPRQYEALVLFFYDEFTYPEIASMLQLNEQSARNLVQRGLLQLRQYAKHIISFFLLLPCSF